MKKFITKTIIVTLITVGFSACSDEYFDVNTPSNGVDLDELNMKNLMGPVIHSTFFAQQSAEAVFGNYTQYFGSYGSGAAGKTQNSSTWDQVYLYILPNLKVIKEKSQAKEAKHFFAIASILEAINIGLAADSWDNIPYSQAIQGIENTHPSYDSQEQIYAQIFTLLDSAISALEAADNSQVSLGKEDLVYGGDKEKWLRAAYTFKARFQLHLMNKGVVTANDVLASIEKGFTSNSDNFKMSFPEDKINPWYSTNILSRKTGNFYRAPNDQLISNMNGTTYPFESGVVQIDPRLPAIFVKEGNADDPWRGFMNGGEGESSDGEDANTYYKDGGYHTTAGAPLILLTYAEAMFIKAEAAFLANSGTTTSIGSNSDAYIAYQNGISASMAEVGVDGADYMADTAIDVGEGSLMLNHIMKEKYVANIHNVETYNDMRRYNFSSDVFKGLALRLEVDTDDDEFKGKWFRRAIYPTSEKNANETVVNANWQEPTVSVWWAQ